jgi:hypothetical protein
MMISFICSCTSKQIAYRFIPTVYLPLEIEENTCDDAVIMPLCEKKKHHASELTLVCWSRKGSLGPGNPRHQRSRTVGETRYDPSCRIDLQGI